MNIDWKQVEARPGDPVLPAWEAMKRAVRSLRLIPGRGVRVAYGPQGTTISADDGVGGGGFGHPFTVALSGATATVSRGLVNGMEPQIGGVVISGGGKPSPKLTLGNGVVDPVTLQSWVCVEVTPKEDGTLDPKVAPVIVHRGKPMSTDAAVGRQPLALLVWDGTGAAAPALYVQVTYFNLKYVRKTPGAGQPGVVQHFFL